MGYLQFSEIFEKYIGALYFYRMLLINQIFYKKRSPISLKLPFENYKFYVTLNPLILFISKTNVYIHSIKLILFYWYSSLSKNIMLLLVIVAAFLCSSTTQASELLTVFYPEDLTESICSDFNSWTEWSNTALLAIRQAYGRDICAIPRAMQETSVGDISNVDPYPGSWSLMDNFIAGFHSNIPVLDSQVRFCCRNVHIESTTRAAITLQPVTNDTCCRAEIKHSLASRIFGGSYVTPNSWP